jgi:hypothetical protein
MRDVYRTKHPANYFDHMLVKSEDSAIELMKTYAVHPPDDADQDRGNLTQELGGYRRADIRVTDMTRPVASLHLSRAQRGQRIITGNEGGDTLTGVASYRVGAPGVPVYWLPWDSGGAVISLTIPRMGTRAMGEPDPDRFFTAAINGCSIFFRGTPDNPTVYHCGGDTEVSGAHASALFWHNLMINLHGGVGGEVNKEDYITTEGVKGGPRGTITTTQAAKDYEAWLKASYSKQLEIEDVRPWGCVMGIRGADGNWRFFLQENATVSYFVLKKKHLFSKERVREHENVKVRDQNTGKLKTKHDANTNEVVTADRLRMLSRPLRFHEIWPNRPVTVRLDRPIPKSKHG